MLNSWVILLMTLASPCKEVELKGEVSPSDNTIRGQITCMVASNSTVSLASYQAELDHREAGAIDDVSRAFLYPRGEDPGAEFLKLDGDWVPSGPRVLGSFEAGAKITVEFVHQLGRRTGLKGNVDGIFAALSGWHPLFVLASGGASEVPIRYQLALPSKWVGLVGATARKRGAPWTAEGTFIGRYLPLVLAKEMRVQAGGTGVILWPRERRANLLPAAGRGVLKLEHLDDERVIEHLEDTLMLGDQFIHRAVSDGDNHPAPPPMVVVLPMRQKLVERFDGGFAVSDRVFSVFEDESFLAFHRAVLWRYQLGYYLRHLLRGFEVSSELSLASDFVGAALRDALVEDIYGSRDWASDLLDDFIVIPEIDALLHAPQIPFPEAYFRAILEDVAAYTPADRFETGRPAGKLIYEKCKDLLGPDETQRLVYTYLNGDRPFWDLVDGYGSDLAERLRQWLGPYPVMDYALEYVMEADGEHVLAVTQQQGLGQEELPVEPVTVRLYGDDGSHEDKTRLGPGKLRFPAVAGFERAVLDPNKRLVELSHQPGEQSRYNNLTSPRWLFMLNNIAGLVGVTAETLSVSGSFSLRRQYDQRYRYAFALQHTPSAVGGSLGMAYGFGGERTAMSLAHHLRVNLGYYALREEGLSLEPGREGYLALSYGHDTRLSPHYSLEGRGLKAHVLGGFGEREDGEAFGYWRAGVAGLYLSRMGASQSLVLRLRADYLGGDAPAQSQLRLGGIYRGARGFESSSLRALGFRGIASLEHRHVFFSHARQRLLSGALVWTRLEGALFADAVHLPQHQATCEGTTFYDVGYGLRWVADVMSVSPAMVALDVGMPITQCEELNQRPFTVYLSFLQSFSVF